MTMDQMGRAVEYILKAQGFASRFKSYKIVEQRSEFVVGIRSVVQHRLSRQNFCMQAVSKNSHPQNMELFQMQVLALQKLVQSKRVVGILDYFEDDNGVYLITELNK